VLEGRVDGFERSCVEGMLMASRTHRVGVKIGRSERSWNELSIIVEEG
jgi:hypothetical protein